MKWLRERGRFAVVLIAVVMAFASAPVSAADHESGGAWTYQMSANIDVGEFAVDMFGNVTFDFEGQGSLVENSIESDVDIIRVNGELSGTLDMFGGPLVFATAVMDGTLYETDVGVGTVKEDMRWLISASVGSDSYPWLVQLDTRMITTYLPAFMSEFDPDSTELGDQWSESMRVNFTVTSTENGTEEEVFNDRSLESFDFSVESTMDSIITPAGTYDAMRITIADENGDHEVLWWSDEVGYYVKSLSYYAGDDEAYESMVLISYEKPGSDSTTLVLVLGIDFTIIAIIVLVVVLMHTRRPKP